MTIIIILIVLSIIASILVLASVMMASIIEERERIAAQFREHLPMVRMPAALKEKLRRWINEETRDDS